MAPSLPIKAHSLIHTPAAATSPAPPPAAAAASPFPALAASAWRLHDALRAGDRCAVSVTLPRCAPPVDLWLTGPRPSPAFAVPAASDADSTRLFYVMPVAPGAATLELRRASDAAVCASHPVSVAAWAPAAAAAPTPSVAAPPAKAKAPAAAESGLRSSDPLSLLSAMDDAPAVVRRRDAPAGAGKAARPAEHAEEAAAAAAAAAAKRRPIQSSGTPPLPDMDAPVPKQKAPMKAVVEAAGDDESGGTEEIPEYNGTLPLPSDEGNASESKSSPQHARGDSVTATVPLPD